jgi:hypothetical protein
MATVDLATLETRIRTRCDMTNSEFISTSEFVTWINGSYAELYDLLVAAGADYFTKSATFAMTGPTVSLVGTGGVAEDFYKALGLDYSIGGGNTGYAEVAAFSMADRNRSERRSYRIMADTLYVYPQQCASGNYRLWYVPLPPTLVTPAEGEEDTDSFQDYGGWAEYVVVDCCIKAMNKQETDPSAFMAEKKALKDRIVSMAKSRDHAAPPVVQDVKGPSAWYC